MIQVTDQTFSDEVANSKVPVLVTFQAHWCGPCKQLAPLLELLAQRRGASLKLVGIDFDASPGLAGQYGVKILPTMILFQGGMAIGKRSGNPGSVAALERMLDGAVVIP